MSVKSEHDDSNDTQTILEIRSPERERERHSARGLGLREGRKGRKDGARKGQDSVSYMTGWTREATVFEAEAETARQTTENPIQWPCGTWWCYYEALVLGPVANVVAEECQALVPGLCLI
ncbi:hypothetical protein LIA77_04162 [Sarocladium implicatum]|nr:hypothetical protein LIA77_04162 [Sarocladium implicatum]